MHSYECCGIEATHSGEDSGVRLDISSCVGTVEARSKFNAEGSETDKK